MGGPVLGARIDPTLIKDLGDLQLVARLAQKEITELERRAQKLQNKSGGTQTLSPDEIAKLKHYEGLYDNTKGEIAKQVAAGKAEAKMVARQAAVKEAAEGMKAVFAGRAVRGFLDGRDLNLASLSSMALASDRAIVKTATLFGAKTSTLEKLERALPLLPLFVESLHMLHESLEQAKQERQEAKRVGSLYGAGRMSKELFDLFQSRQQFWAIGGAQKQVEAIQGATEALLKLPDKAIAPLLKKVAKAYTDEDVPVATYLPGVGPLSIASKRTLPPDLLKEIRSSIKYHVKERETELGHKLTPEQLRKTVEGVLVDLLQGLGISNGKITEIAEAFVKAAEQYKTSTAVEPEKAAAQVVIERNTNRIKQYLAQQHRTFSADVYSAAIAGHYDDEREYELNARVSVMQMDRRRAALDYTEGERKRAITTIQFEHSRRVGQKVED